METFCALLLALSTSSDTKEDGSASAAWCGFFSSMYWIIVRMVCFESTGVSSFAFEKRSKYWLKRAMYFPPTSISGGSYSLYSSLPTWMSGYSFSSNT